MTETNELDPIIQFTNDVADAPDPQPLPEGEYPAAIENAVFELGKTSRKPMISVTTRITDFPADFVATEEQKNGIKVRYWATGILDDQNRPTHRMRKFLENLGLKTNVRQFDVTSLIGMEVITKIGVSMFNGEVQNNIIDIRGA